MDNQNQQEERKESDLRRSHFLLTIAGAYLMYLAYRLGENFLVEVEKGWGSDTVVSLLFAVIFLAGGGYLLFRGAAYFLRGREVDSIGGEKTEEEEQSQDTEE